MTYQYHVIYRCRRCNQDFRLNRQFDYKLNLSELILDQNKLLCLDDRYRLVSIASIDDVTHNCDLSLENVTKSIGMARLIGIDFIGEIQDTEEVH